jgi:hypothetical protein
MASAVYDWVVLVPAKLYELKLIDIINLLNCKVYLGCLIARQVKSVCRFINQSFKFVC